jgi:hypothetical protein
MMVSFRVPAELVEECGRLLVWRRLNQDAEGLLQGERFKEEVVRHLGEALWQYLVGLNDAAALAPGDVFVGVTGAASVGRRVKRSKRDGS